MNKKSSYIKISNMQPISTALQVQTSAQKIARAIKIIDNAHVDGILPTAPVEEVTGKGPGGWYQISPSAIFVAAPCSEHELSFIHEVGHFLDHKALDPGQPNFASMNANNNDMSAWMYAVLQSDEIVSLRESHIKAEDLAMSSYLLDPREVWARCYTQWIVERSQDASLQLALNKRRNSQNRFIARSQWIDVNFSPISQEIKNLFRTRGWI